jgi:hypothetical protein
MRTRRGAFDVGAWWPGGEWRDGSSTGAVGLALTQWIRHRSSGQTMVGAHEVVMHRLPSTVALLPSPAMDAAAAPSSPSPSGADPAAACATARRGGAGSTGSWIL